MWSQWGLGSLTVFVPCELHYANLVWGEPEYIVHNLVKVCKSQGSVGLMRFLDKPSVTVCNSEF